MFQNKNLFAACAFDLSVEAIDPCLSLSPAQLRSDKILRVWAARPPGLGIWDVSPVS